jgi:hypothetical protein
LRRHEHEIDELGLGVLVVTFERPEVAADYAREIELRWPLVVDPDRALYHAYGMSRGSFWQIFGPRALLNLARLVRQGYRTERATGDTRQLGGNVLVDPAGRVVLHHVGEGPADRPPVEALLREIRSHASNRETAPQHPAPGRHASKGP